MKKYTLTDDTKQVEDNHGVHTLHRVLYTDEFVKTVLNPKKESFLGGWIESEKNLSQDDNALVLNEAIVMENAQARENAIIEGNAIISNYAIIEGNTHIKDNVKVSDYAHISGNTDIKENANIRNNVFIMGEDVSIRNNAVIGGHTYINGEVIIIDDDVFIDGNVNLFGRIAIHDKASITGDTIVNGFVSKNGHQYYDIDECTILITENAEISGGTILGEGHYTDNAHISGNPYINSKGFIVVADNARIGGNVIIEGNFCFLDNAYVTGHTKMTSDFTVEEKRVNDIKTTVESQMFNIKGDTFITGNTIIHNTPIEGDTEIGGNAIINNCKLKDVKISGYNNKSYTNREMDNIIIDNLGRENLRTDIETDKDKEQDEIERD